MIQTTVLETGYNIGLDTGFEGSLVLYNIRTSEIIKEVLWMKCVECHKILTNNDCYGHDCEVF